MDGYYFEELLVQPSRWIMIWPLYWNNSPTIHSVSRLVYQRHKFTHCWHNLYALSGKTSVTFEPMMLSPGLKIIYQKKNFKKINGVICKNPYLIFFLLPFRWFELIMLQFSLPRLPVNNKFQPTLCGNSLAHQEAGWKSKKIIYLPMLTTRFA